MKGFTFGSLFAGIGGFDLGLEKAGMSCSWQVEIDDFATTVLEKNWPNVKRYGDIRNVGRKELQSVDVVCGGFPCQDIAPGSSTKSGLLGERSGLWHEYYRVVCEIRPKWVVVENSSNLISSNNGEDFGEILRSLAAIGYDAEWAVLSASAMGAYHRRKRAFLLAYDNEVYGKKRVGNILSQTPLFSEGGIRSNGAWVQTPRDFIGMDDGVSGGAYRRRVGALGNAVVPQVAEFVGISIVNADEFMRNMI